MYIYTYTHFKKWPEILAFFVAFKLQRLFIFLRAKARFGDRAVEHTKQQKKTNSNALSAPTKRHNLKRLLPYENYNFLFFAIRIISYAFIHYYCDLL